MIIIGVDYHPEFQQIASVDTSTGEFQEKRLVHPGRRSCSTVHWQAKKCGSAWKRAVMLAGSNDC